MWLLSATQTLIRTHMLHHDLCVFGHNHFHNSLLCFPLRTDTFSVSLWQPEPTLQSGILQACRSHGYDVFDYRTDESRAREIPQGGPAFRSTDLKWPC